MTLPTPWLECQVPGLPAPQGSKRGFNHPHTGRVILVEQSKNVAPWRNQVSVAAYQAIGGRPPLEGPVDVWLAFTLPKPKSAPKTRQTWPIGRTHDTDKLSRAVLDALTDAGAWKDDGQVLGLHGTKGYPGEDEMMMDRPGCWLVIRPHIQSVAGALVPTPRNAAAVRDANLAAFPMESLPGIEDSMMETNT